MSNLIASAGTKEDLENVYSDLTLKKMMDSKDCSLMEREADMHLINVMKQ